MATLTVRGKASMSGNTATFDVILYPVQQSMKVSQQWEEEIVKDAVGQDAAWLARNEKYDGDLMMKLIGDTAAHAQAGAAFLGPLAIVTITACLVTLWNSTWQVVPGSDIALSNDKVGDISFKLRRYTDSTQNTLAAATPS
jgi:hypothetical protein